MTLDLQTDMYVDLGFDRVQELRDMLDIMLSYAAHCRANLRVVESLRNADTTTSQLDTFSFQLLDYVDCISTLSDRTRSLIDLVSLPYDFGRYDIRQMTAGSGRMP